MNDGFRPAQLGAHLGEGDCCSFTVWAPRARQVEVHLHGPPERTVELEPAGRGYFTGSVDAVAPGTLYRFRLDGERELPDPASRSQPRGVHGPSAVVARDFAWTDDDWSPPRLADYVIYEVHVGCFTAQGTFDALQEHLEYVHDLGITAIELMPVAQFPGDRNWGYDGVYPFAAQSSYGGPEGLKRLVDACHRTGLAVILDVVYNHLGPEGNYLSEFGHYFTERYRTPWGAALNFDGQHSDEVREYFIQNALQWTGEFHIDALRLDAVHAIVDNSAQPFLREVAGRVHEHGRAAGRDVYLIAESDLGDPRIMLSPDRGGYGMDGQWLDDFHHSLHTLLTEEAAGYYIDFRGIEPLARSFRQGYVYAGQYSAYRRRRHGAPAPDARAEQFVVYSQNHDQIGNRLAGDRLTAQLGFEPLKLAAAAVILSPFVPLLFMGEEYGETAPFPYFVRHTDAALIEAVRAGRRDEFASFAWADEPPDPQAIETFVSGKLDHGLRERGRHTTLLAFYRHLLRLRREYPPSGRLDDIRTEVVDLTLIVYRPAAQRQVILVLNFAARPASLQLGLEGRQWRSVLDSAAPEWDGPGSFSPALLLPASDVRLEVQPHTATLLVREA